MASALAGVLDQIEILVGADLLDPDKHRGAPWRSSPKHHEKRDSVKTKRTERLSYLAPQNELTAQKPSIYGRSPTQEKAKPWKLGLNSIRLPCCIRAFRPQSTA